jgi:flagellin
MTISVDTANNVLLTLKGLNGQQAASVQSATTADSSSTNAAASAILTSSSGGGNSQTGLFQGLSRAASISDLTVAATGVVGGLLSQLQQTAAQAADPSTDATTRQGLNTDYKALIGKIQATVQSASFDGVNLLDGSTTAAAQFAVDPDGATSSLTGQDLALGGPVLTVASTSSIGTASAAASTLSDISQSVTNLQALLVNVTNQANQITAHGGLMAQVSGLTGGASNPDADGAKLAALQIQQQLADAGQSIANQAPQQVLALFR